MGLTGIPADCRARFGFRFSFFFFFFFVCVALRSLVDIANQGNP